MTWRLTKGRARQFIVTNENRRCSIPAFVGTSLVPFARSRREVVNFDVEAELVGERRDQCAEWRSVLPWSGACGRKPDEFFSAARLKMLQ
jgi:hypothetical protein